MRTWFLQTRLPAVLVLLSGWVVSASASAQVVYNNASTVGESYAKGLGDVISSQGNYNLATSQATLNMQEAVKKNIENRQLWTNAYFEMRKANREYTKAERGPQPTMETITRFAQMGAPKRLDPKQFDYVTGNISWPLLLQSPDFAAQRDELNALFKKRAQIGGVSLDDQMAIRQATGTMLGELRSKISDMPSGTYMSARRFIESLAYESQLPPNS